VSTEPGAGQVGNKAYKVRAEAEKEVAVVCK
jgi:hypothetical protein